MPQALCPLLTAALRRGIQVETHAIGDRGNRIMLDLQPMRLLRRAIRWLSFMRR
jgi:predicted amidohydrolase YtcJ